MLFLPIADLVSKRGLTGLYNIYELSGGYGRAVKASRRYRESTGQGMRVRKYR